MAVLKYYNTTTSAWEYIAASTTANFTSWKKTMAGGETSVSGTDDNAVTLSYTVGLEQVFINGVLQVRGSDYTATTGTSITGLTALVASDVVTVVCYAPFNVANTIAPSLVDAKGDLLAGTAADTVGRLAVGTNNYSLVADSSTSTGLKWLQSANIVQIQFAEYNTQTAITAQSWNDSGLSVSITPTSASNKILVFASAKVSVNRNSTLARGGVRLVRDSTAIVTHDSPRGYGMVAGGNGGNQLSSYGTHAINYLDSPNTTSAVTYKIQGFAETSSTIYFQEAATGASTIIVMEVTP
jgi:hypothetical protein